LKESVEYIPVIVIFGSTGVGKTDFALSLGHTLPIEIINGDMGQLYTPLAIGTAKPAWRNEPLPHHLFDCVHEPVHYSAYSYRQACQNLIGPLQQQGVIPVIVGGTGFYIQSLFFPPVRPCSSSNIPGSPRDPTALPLWDTLMRIDPQRAQELHPHDTYRIERALAIWQQYGIKPSLLKPSFAALGDTILVFLDRDVEDSHARINQRTMDMLAQGWVDEVRSLTPSWRSFVQAKGLLGYPELVELIEQQEVVTDAHKALVAAKIQQKTRAYARKQRMFWRLLKTKITQQAALTTGARVTIEEINLTQVSPEAARERIIKQCSIKRSLVKRNDIRISYALQ
jgi:tRNA dimethylallyltransferase